MIRFILDKKGNSQLVAVIIAIPVILIALCVAMGGLAYMNTHKQVDDFADELITKAGEIGKCSGPTIENRYEELKKATGLSPSIQFTATYFDEIKKTVQYGDTITLTVTLDTKLFGFFDFHIPKTITRVKTTQSEQYWK